MKIFLDADILFNSVHNLRTRTLLRRIKNAGHDIIVPVSVLGEVMLVCIAEDRRDDLIEIRDTCSDLDISFAAESKGSKMCGLCLENFDKREFNITDKTNLANALAYSSSFRNIDSYFMTTDLYLLRFKLPCEDPKIKCSHSSGRSSLEIVHEDEVRSKL